MPSGHGKIQLMRKQQTMLLRDTILQIFAVYFWHAFLDTPNPAG